MDFNTDQWSELRQTDTGVKILVTGDGNNLKSVFFKGGNRRPGPIIFNEYLAYKLGLMLGYPLPKIEFLKFNEELGCISWNIPESNPWQSFPKDNVLQFMEDPTVFAKIVVLDIWIRNMDRHDRNLMVQNIKKDKYKVFMIDHEHSLYGTEAAPPTDILDFSNIVKIPELKSLIPNLDLLLTEVEKITKISDDELKGLVDNLMRISDNQFSPTQSQIVKELLIQRKNLLSQKITDWYNQQP